MGSDVIVVDVSSDEEENSRLNKRRGGGGGLDWLQEMIVVEDGGDGDGGSDEVIVFDELSAPATKRRKGSKSPRAKRSGVAAGEVGGDEDCMILEVNPDGLIDAVDGGKPTGGIDDDDLLIIAEKGQVACRDYPHSRNLCANFPFDTTAHKDHCSLCHCYVCDSLAPCKYWGNGSLSTDHCNSTEKDGRWKSLRQSKQNNMVSSQSQKLLDNIRLPCQNQVSSQCFPQPVFSSTPNPRSNVLQPCSGINTANLGSKTQGHYRSPSIFSHRTRSGLSPAISHQSNFGTVFLQKEHCFVNACAPIRYFRKRYKRHGTSRAGFSSLNNNEHHSIDSVDKHIHNNVLENSSTAAAKSQKHLCHDVRPQMRQNSSGGSSNVGMDHIRSTLSGSWYLQ